MLICSQWNEMIECEWRKLKIAHEVAQLSVQVSLCTMQTAA
jgi:hypothetical protein